MKFEDWKKEHGYNMPVGVVVNTGEIVYNGSLGDFYLTIEEVQKKYREQKLKERPDWDSYFLLLAYCVSLRSDDFFIKHGAVIINSAKHIIGTGYNNTIRGADLSVIEPENRDLRRNFMVHAEENAILNSIVNPLNIGGATLYCTGLPCNNCLQRIINFGITRVVYSIEESSILHNEESQKMREQLVKMSGIVVEQKIIDKSLIKQLNNLL